MESKNAVLDERSDRKIIEEVGKRLPNIGVSVLSNTLVVKSIHLSDLAAFMISTQNHNTVRPSDFQRNQQSCCFQRIVSTIDIIT